MFQVDCAYHVVDGALRLLHDSDAPDGHDDWCVLRVHFDVTEIYPAERDTGCGFDWNGDIGSIEWRVIGANFRRFHRLHGDELEAARDFLLRIHGAALWQAGGDFAEELQRGEAAA